MDEPKPNKIGYYTYKYRGEPYVIAHVGWKRRQRVYYIVYPKLDFTGSWNECVAECQVHYLTHIQKRKARRRR